MMKSCVVIVALIAFAPAAHAVTITDNESTLICAIVDLASCAPGDGCRRETADSINAPQLVTVNRKEHVITAHRPDGELLSTNIDRASVEQDLLVFDGVQDNLSWTVTISQENGHMSLSAIGDGKAFTVFGSCEVK
jgi:hypothetical protein